MKTQMRNFVFDVVVSTLFISVSSWAVQSFRVPETVAARPAMNVPPACRASVLHWPKETTPDRSEMAPPQAVP